MGNYSEINSDLEKICADFANDIFILGLKIMACFKNVERKKHSLWDVVRGKSKNLSNVEKELFIESFSFVIGSVRNFLLSEKLSDSRIEFILDFLIIRFPVIALFEINLTKEELGEFHIKLLNSVVETKEIYYKKLPEVWLNNETIETQKIENRFELAYQQKVSLNELMLLRITLGEIGNLAYPKFMARYRRLYCADENASDKKNAAQSKSLFEDDIKKLEKYIEEGKNKSSNTNAQDEEKA